MIHGIDVSNWQGRFDWAKQQIAFAFAKATEGTAFTDPQFARNWREMSARKLVRGAYHFGRPGSSATAQADHFVNVVRAQGLHDGDLLALDLETKDGRKPADVAPWARAWCGHVQKATGIRPIVYTFVSFARDGSCAGLGGYPLWIAAPSYAAGKPPMPLGPWSNWVIHQYSDNPIDKDVSKLSAAQLRALGHGGDDVAAKDVWSYEIPKTAEFPEEWEAGTHLRHTTVMLGKLAAGQAALAKQAGVEVDEQAIAAAIIQAMSVDTLAALIKTGLASEVVDELKARL